MYAKYAKLRIDQIPMTKLLLDMREPSNRSHIKLLKDSMQSLLDREGLKDYYTIFAYQDVLDNTSKVSGETALLKFLIRVASNTCDIFCRLSKPWS